MRHLPRRPDGVYFELEPSIIAGRRRAARCVFMGVFREFDVAAVARGPARLAGGAALVALLLCSGCWDEVHYKASRPAQKSTTDEPAAKAGGEPVAAEGETKAAPFEEPADATPSSHAPPTAAELFSPEPLDNAAAEPALPPEDGGRAASSDASGGDVEPTAEPHELTEQIEPTPAVTEPAEVEPTEAEPADAEPATPPTIEFTRPSGAAAPAVEPAEAPATSQQRFEAWTAASQWSLAAAIYAKGLDAARYEPILAAATAAAKEAGIELPPLPTTGDARSREAIVITFLRGEPGAELTDRFAERLGAAEGAAARLAIGSHLLLLTYSSRSAAAANQAAALRAAGEASELPPALWEPLAKLLDERAEFLEVRQGVFDMHRRVAKHLAGQLTPGQ